MKPEVATKLSFPSGVYIFLYMYIYIMYIYIYKHIYIYILYIYIIYKTQHQYIATFVMLMNCFCGMVEQRKALSRQVSDMPQAGFEPAQNLSSCFIE